MRRAARYLAPAFTLLCGGVPAGYLIRTGLQSPEPWFRWPCIVLGIFAAAGTLALAIRIYRTEND